MTATHGAMSIIYLGMKSPRNPHNLSQEAMGALLGSYIYHTPDRPRVLLPSCSLSIPLVTSLKRKKLIEDSGHGSGSRPNKEGIVWKLTPLGIKEYERLLEMYLQEDEL